MSDSLHGRKGALMIIPNGHRHVAGPFRENRAQFIQLDSLTPENQKAPPGWHRTRPDHNALEVRHG